MVNRQFVPLTKLEILLSCALLVAMIGLIYFVWIVPSEFPKMLKSTIEACNANYEALRVNYGQQSPYAVSGWDIRDYLNNSKINQTLAERNLTIETGLQRYERRYRNVS